MAFFGYDPFRGVSNLGSTIAQAGQQVGGLISQIPQLRQQEQQQAQQQRLGAQQERAGELGIQNQEFQLKRQEEIQNQMKQNPKQIADVGKILSEDLMQKIETLPDNIKDDYVRLAEKLNRSYQIYESAPELSNEQAMEAKSKIEKDYSASTELINMIKKFSTEGATTAESKQGLAQFMAKNYPELSMRKLKDTPLYAGLPEGQKPVDELTKAKIATEKVRKSKFLADIDKIKAGLKGKGGKDSEFLATELNKLRTAEEKADTELAKVDASINKVQTIIEAFEGATDYVDPKTLQPVSESQYDEAVRRMGGLEKRKETLVQGKEARQQSFMDVLPEGSEFGPDEPKREITASTQVGDYPTNWTLESKVASKELQNVLDEIKNNYGDLIKDVSDKHGVPEDLIVAIMAQESKGNPNAENESSKAQGLMQIMPDNLKHFKIPKNKWKDPATNIDVAGRLLKRWLRVYGKKKGLESVVAAYNAGDVRVNNDTWKTRKETLDYVPKVRGYLEHLQSLKKPEVELETPSIEVPVVETNATPTAQALTGKPAPATTAKSSQESNIRRTWDNEGIEGKKDILIRLEKYKDRFPELISELKSKLVEELKAGRG
ncbi:MAG: hypothetical protein CMI54_07890 [Parcubacteria group bacterium]|jgi:hypothetical protein|nr:hypothetical protein [Parcubacteria group bacterium]|tara:strand:+ start:11953 stop:13767 length:1815 start_codon:yes stop_codon:yes gene_type:complete